jgi:two-component system NarL family response regulator
MKKVEPANLLRILIADDHSVVREGLAALIGRNSGMTVVAEAADGREAVRLYFDTRPDVAMLDLRMPSMSGLEAIQEIVREDPTPRLIILTTFDGDDDIYRSLRAGAKAYLLKDAPREQIIEAILAVYQGRPAMSADVAQKLAFRLGAEELTERERNVLDLMAAGKRNAEIAMHLSITEGTVKTHVNSILGKLGTRSRTEAVTVALACGLAHLSPQYLA